MIGGIVLAALLAAPREAATQIACVQLKRPLPAGATLGRRDLQFSACPGAEPERAFRYDPGSGFARAARDLAAGEVFAAVPAALVADVVQGDTLYLKSRVGAVEVERTVTAVRPGRIGEPVLVRGADGLVFEAPKLEGLQ